MTGATGATGATEPGYPVVLRLAGKRVLVVGAGRVAARKVEALVEAGAAVTVVAPAVVPELSARDDVTIERRPYVSDDVAGYWLVVVCTDDEVVQQRVFDDGERLGVWVNAADDPDRCAFTLPAVARRGPVIVAVSTSGASPALAQALRDRAAAAALPDGIEDVAAHLAAERRRIQAEGGSTEDLEWRPLVERLLDALGSSN